jgi:hypothetical protein
MNSKAQIDRRNTKPDTMPTPALAPVLKAFAVFLSGVPSRVASGFSEVELEVTAVLEVSDAYSAGSVMVRNLSVVMVVRLGEAKARITVSITVVYAVGVVTVFAVGVVAVNSDCNEEKVDSSGLTIKEGSEENESAMTY